MTTDLWCAVAMALWGIAFAYVPVLGKVRVMGVAWGFGNRDRVAEGAAAWVDRADRAYLNHIANIAPFVTVVLVAHVADKHDDVTAGASIAFVIGRVLHALFYVLGVQYLRSVAFWVSLGGILVIVSRLA